MLGFSSATPWHKMNMMNLSHSIFQELHLYRSFFCFWIFFFTWYVWFCDFFDIVGVFKSTFTLKSERKLYLIKKSGILDPFFDPFKADQQFLTMSIWMSDTVQL